MKYDGVVIFRQDDEFGPVEVVQNRSSRKLYFGSPIEQSCQFLNAPMQLGFEYHEKMLSVYQDFLDRTPVSKNAQALILGLGGGSLTTHLNLHHPKLPITTVELRAPVIAAAYQFFHLPQVPELQVVQADALDFVKQTEPQFQVVFVDLYNEFGMPSEFYSSEFQTDLQQILPQKQPGLVIFNLWNDDQPACNDFIAAWQQMAKENPRLSVKSYQIQSSENIILAIQQG